MRIPDAAAGGTGNPETAAAEVTVPSAPRITSNGMSLTLTHRPRWAIDLTLERLQGEDVRVAALMFAPVRGDQVLLWTPVRHLILPDNSAAAGLPVYFEGRLQTSQRQIGRVSVELAAPRCPEASAEGIVWFRGRTVVLVQGPALVQLAYPFCVEPLPRDEPNYWKDLQLPRAQLELAL